MNHVKKSLIITAVLVVILGIIGQNIIGNYYYSQPSNSNSKTSSSVVYIENGVTGDVSITDPFLNRTTDINVIYDPLDSGSGFIVNNNGYIVTAYHVISDPNTLKNQMILRLMNSNDIKLYVERAAVTGYISKYNPQLGSELVSNSLPGNPTIIQSQPDPNSTTDMLIQRNLLTVKSSQQLIKVKLPGTSSANSISANLVDEGNPIADEDVALLKVNTLFKNLPTLTINSKSPSVGDKIQIYGYPAVNNQMYSDINPSTIKPSSTTGFLTAEIPNNGTIYYETNAISEHGYSGGPVLDVQNNVLGIIIYSVSPNQTSTGTSSLFLSSNYIIQICNKNNVPINVI